MTVTLSYIISNHTQITKTYQAVLIAETEVKIIRKHSQKPLAFCWAKCYDFVFNLPFRKMYYSKYAVITLFRQLPVLQVHSVLKFNAIPKIAQSGTAAVFLRKTNGLSRKKWWHWWISTSGASFRRQLTARFHKDFMRYCKRTNCRWRMHGAAFPPKWQPSQRVQERQHVSSACLHGAPVGMIKIEKAWQKPDMASHFHQFARNSAQFLQRTRAISGLKQKFNRTAVSCAR